MTIEQPHNSTRENHNHLLVVLTAAVLLIPLFLTPVLPLVDYYSHIVRYYILSGGVKEPELAANYLVSWKLLPNLGMDILGSIALMAFSPLLAAKILAAVLIFAPYAGVLMLAYCLHGRITLVHIALASICSYNLVLAWGFANFLLGFSLALASLGFWIAQRRNPSAQIAVAILMGLIIVLVHGLVFAIWGMLLLSCELALALQQGESLKAIVVRTCRLLAVAALPVLFFLSSSTVGSSGGFTKSFANFQYYVAQDLWLERLLLEADKRFLNMLQVAQTVWSMPDIVFGAILWGLLAFLLARRTLRVSCKIVAAVIVIAVLVIIVPPNLFDVGHLDERFPFVLLCLLSAAIVPVSNPERARWLGAVFATMAIVHISMAATGWYQVGKSYTGFLSSINSLPTGGYVTLVEGDTAKVPAGSRFCKPLASLVFLLRHSGVDTFANVTQQPLEIVGELKRLNEAVANRRTGVVGAAAMSDGMLSDGFDKVVLCGTDLQPGSKGILVGKGSYWILLTR